jgi:aspartyl-tRNA(Asn)/glutamyl-tRNA(Gln) amidotransferase subunit A
VHADLAGYTALELSSLIAKHELSPVELLESCLIRIHEANADLNAFCLVAADRAQAEAQRVTQSLGRKEELGPLAGIPIAVKDVNLTHGMRTTFGSRAFADFVPTEDAASVASIREAGGIVLGKTTTPEFGCKGICESPLHGRTINPWNSALTTGGSSGGAAAAIAAGLVPLADGSDGAGSIRIPASFCGVVGFKPSFGRVSVLPRSTYESLVHVGPIARTVGDTALMFGAMCDHRSREELLLNRTEDVVALLERADISGWKIAFSTNLGLASVASEVIEQTSAAVERLAHLGAHVEAVTPNVPDPREPMMTMWKTTYGLIVRDRILPRIQREHVDQDLIRLLDASVGIDAYTYYQAAIIFRHEFARAMAQFFENYRLLVTPTAAVLPFPHPVDGLNPASLEGSDAERFLGWVLTYPFNLTGQPAISLPCGYSKSGLPVGLQIVGRNGADLDVLQAAAALETSQGIAKLALPLPFEAFTPSGVSRLVA